LLMGLPFLLYCAADKQRNKFFRLVSGITVPFLFVIVLRTGSRGALIATALLGVMYIVRTTMAKRVSMVIALVLVALIAPVVMPQEVKDRYIGLFLKGDDLNDVQESARVSAETRQKLMEDAFTLTGMHPFLGVGIGQFAPQAAALAASRNEHASWRPAHSFVFLVMTETGLPGVFLYCLAIAFGFMGIWQISKTARRQKNELLLAMSRTLFFSYFAFIVCALLSTNAYTFHVPLMSSLVVGFVRFAKPELQKQLSGNEADVTAQSRNDRYARLRPEPSLAR
jgi:O-antigen ligase